MLRIYINTWGNYNENGADGGKWISLPMEESDLDAELEAVAENMGDADPEWFINDYEWECDDHLTDISENSNLYELNKLAERIADLNDYEIRVLLAMSEAFTRDLTEILWYIEHGRYSFYEDMDLTEVAEEFVEACYFSKDTPDIFRRYFDYEAFGRDLGFDGYTETKWGVIVID